MKPSAAASSEKPGRPSTSAGAHSGKSKGKKQAATGLFDRIWFALAAFVIALLAGALNLTVRYRFEDWQRFEAFSSQKRPVILSLWHNQIFLGTYVLRFLGIAVMTSRHRDGEYIAGVLRLSGYLPVRGSSSERSVAALLEMKNCLKEGRIAAFTIDGPRGPRYRVKGGPVVLAAKTQLPILCFHVEPQRYWEMKSWDRFRIPKPFSRALVKIGQPLEIAPDADRQACLEAYQAEMDRLQKYCESEVASWN